MQGLSNHKADDEYKQQMACNRSCVASPQVCVSSVSNDAEFLFPMHCAVTQRLEGLDALAIWPCACQTYVAMAQGSCGRQAGAPGPVVQLVYPVLHMLYTTKLDE